MDNTLQYDFYETRNLMDLFRVTILVLVDNTLQSYFKSLEDYHKVTILVLVDNTLQLFDPFDDSIENEIHEKIATGEFKTAEEVIAYLKSRHNLD